MLAEGDPIPDVMVTGSDGRTLPLRGFAGAPFVLYFYPKDDTAGCTREALDFTALADAFAGEGAALLGVSKDTPAKHAKFTAKYDLRVPLATDADGAVLEAFGVWVEKSMYGRRYMGIERATFLFDADGRLNTTWRKVKVPGHAEAVLTAVRGLAAG